MSQEEKSKWNRAYREGRSHPHFEGRRSLAVDWAAPLLPDSALTLDLGCGKIRNSLELGQAGHRVLAVDVAIEAFRQAPSWPETVQPVVLDVDAWKIAPRSFDLVIMVHYLNRSKLNCLSQALRPGGLLALEIRIARDDVSGEGSPPFKLKPDEISELFPDLCVRREETFFRGETECIRALLQRPVS